MAGRGCICCRVWENRVWEKRTHTCRHARTFGSSNPPGRKQDLAISRSCPVWGVGEVALPTLPPVILRPPGAGALTPSARCPEHPRSPNLPVAETRRCRQRRNLRDLVPLPPLLASSGDVVLTLHRDLPHFCPLLSLLSTASIPPPPPQSSSRVSEIDGTESEALYSGRMET